VDLLVSGTNLQDTADAIAVTRQTVSGWVNHHAGFQAALNKRRQEFWAGIRLVRDTSYPQSLTAMA
jgi:hypothetical protein